MFLGWELYLITELTRKQCELSKVKSNRYFSLPQKKQTHWQLSLQGASNFQSVELFLPSVCTGHYPLAKVEPALSMDFSGTTCLSTRPLFSQPWLWSKPDVLQVTSRYDSATALLAPPNCLQWPLLLTQHGSSEDTSGPAKCAEAHVRGALQRTGCVCRASYFTVLWSICALAHFWLFRFLSLLHSLVPVGCLSFSLSCSLSLTLSSLFISLCPCLSNNYLINRNITFPYCKKMIVWKRIKSPSSTIPASVLSRFPQKQSFLAVCCVDLLLHSCVLHMSLRRR